MSPAPLCPAPLSPFSSCSKAASRAPIPEDGMRTLDLKADMWASYSIADDTYRFIANFDILLDQPIYQVGAAHELMDSERIVTGCIYVDREVRQQTESRRLDLISNPIDHVNLLPHSAPL